VRKKPYLVRGHDEVLTAARNITSDSLAPIFLTSAVTGARTARVACMECIEKLSTASELLACTRQQAGFRLAYA
jgi:GTPase